MMMLDNLAALAEREAIERVRLLTVIVRANSVHPGNHILLREVLQKINLRRVNLDREGKLTDTPTSNSVFKKWQDVKSGRQKIKECSAKSHENPTRIFKLSSS
jgi:hypothetical protein